MSDLIISEYIEGSDDNKAIEIYNGTGDIIDLSGYELWTITDGGNWAEDTLILNGNLAYNDVYILSMTNADSVIQTVSDSISAFINWDGNDAVGLAKIQSDTIILIDVIGTDGSDPGTGWDVAGVNNATKGHTLVRVQDIIKGNTDWSSSAGTNSTDSEWIVLDMDHFNNLGIYGTSWTGAINSDWDNLGNWDIQIPDSTSNVFIRGFVPQMPVINTSQSTPAKCKKLILEKNSSITIDSSKMIKIFGEF